MFVNLRNLIFSSVYFRRWKFGSLASLQHSALRDSKKFTNESIISGLFVFRIISHQQKHTFSKSLCFKESQFTRIRMIDRRMHKIWDKYYTKYTCPRGGGSFTKIVRGCACRTSKIWLSLYQFFAKFPTHQFTIFERKAPNLDQIGCFLQ